MGGFDKWRKTGCGSNEWLNLIVTAAIGYPRLLSFTFTGAGLPDLD